MILYFILPNQQNAKPCLIWAFKPKKPFAWIRFWSFLLRRNRDGLIKQQYSNAFSLKFILSNYYLCKTRLQRDEIWLLLFPKESSLRAMIATYGQQNVISISGAWRLLEKIYSWQPVSTDQCKADFTSYHCPQLSIEGSAQLLVVNFIHTVVGFLKLEWINCTQLGFCS